MSFNPFNEKPERIDKGIEEWKKVYAKPYDKNSVDPYTKTRIILMNGTEFKSVWMGHQFSRHCSNNDIRRDIALIRRVEQQQQKRIASLKPMDENMLETTISYEQLAVDLTAGLAQREKDKNVKNALDFALLEDFDHLYRFANLLEMDQGVLAERLVGSYTEIMPGRPTISEHRYPYDDIREHVDYKNADGFTKMCIGIITAAEQQTMNFYMNMAGFYKNDLGRKLFSEIGMIEEQHVSQYGSLKDTTASWLENCLMHEYTECFLYYSVMQEETDEEIKKIWEKHLNQEIAHLHKAKQLLEKYEKKDYLEVIPDPEFPMPLTLGPNKEYVRKILKTAWLTADRENYIDVRDLDSGAEFFKLQNQINKNTGEVPSVSVIETYIKENNRDYRFQERPHPIKELDNEKEVNTNVGRVK